MCTVAEARTFVEEVGFYHFWPIKGVELSNLFHTSVSVPPDGHHHDSKNSAGSLQFPAEWSK